MKMRDWESDVTSFFARASGRAAKATTANLIGRVLTLHAGRRATVQLTTGATVRSVEYPDGLPLEAEKSWVQLERSGDSYVILSLANQQAGDA